MRILRAELLKLVYQRAMWWLLVAAILFSTLGTAVTPLIIDQTAAGLGLGTLADTNVVDSVYANAISGYIFSVIIGVLVVAGEFRHGTAVATFVAHPRRGRVLAAKLVVAGVAGLSVQVLATGVGVAAGYLALLGYPEAASPSPEVFPNTAIAAVVSGVVLGIFGAAVGALLRSQLIAIMSVLIWLFAIEPILLVLLPEQGKFFLSGLITAIIALDVQSAQFNLDTGNYLSPLVATLLLLGYGVIFAVVAVSSSLRRDID